MTMQLPRLDYAPAQTGSAAELVRAVCSALADPLGGCIVCGMPCSEDDVALQALALALGEPLLEPHNLAGGMVCRVEVEASEARPYANTPFHFPGHTDCTDYAAPPDTVLLLCERQAASGGDSFVAPLSAIWPRLAPADLLSLSLPRFYFRYGYLPILSKRQGQFAIRYNRTLMKLYPAPDGPDPEREALLDRLDAAIAAASFSFALTPGDCLILDNHVVVHGRSAFEDGAGRLMKRVRLDRAPA